MRYETPSRLVRGAVAMALAVALSATFTFSIPQSASAAPRAKTITRAQVIKRARTWVKRRVPYSQSAYRRGYRQDCSGFVSMAWKLGRSYTTRSLPSVARRVPKHRAQPGDAVLWPGHAAIFGGWKNKRAGTFYAYEQPTWGKVAQKRVRSMNRGARVLRRPGIRTNIASRSPKPATTAVVPQPAVKIGAKPLESQTVTTVMP